MEKTKVNLENEAAQVEAEKCGVIAKDVTELQARCEKDLAAAEPLVAQAEAALDTLNKKDLGQSPSCVALLPFSLLMTHSILLCYGTCMLQSDVSDSLTGHTLVLGASRMMALCLLCR